MSVRTIENSDEWSTIKEVSKEEEKSLFVDFKADWCGPCRIISPYFEQLSEMYDGIFVQIDVDNLEDVAAECGVSAMPTFMVFNDGEKVDELVGASRDRLHALVEKHAQAYQAN